MSKSLVPEILAEYGSATRGRLEAFVRAAAPEPYIRDVLLEYPARGGKMLRPSLCIATAKAFGASLEDAVSTAVAIELLHNGILVHDDIEDHSELRRGRPTLHEMHGIPIAINAGDMLLLMALRPLLENFDTLGPGVAAAILVETEKTAWAVAKGQAMELEWCRANRFALDDRDYLEMVFKKTASLGMVYPTRVGVLIGSRGRADPGRADRFGFFLGAAFQIRDDLLNLEASPAYGKEREGDLFEGKRTLMLLHAWRRSARSEREQLAEILSGPRQQRTEEQVRWMRALMERRGSIEHAQGVANAIAGAALFEFDVGFGDLPETDDKHFLRSLIPWVMKLH